MSSQTTQGFIQSSVQPAGSCGPTLGKLSSRSLDFFYLCSYDVDGLREFLKIPLKPDALEKRIAHRRAAEPAVSAEQPIS